MKVTIPLKQLRQRVTEIPLERDDCYLISILDRGEEVGSRRDENGEYDENGVYPIPFLAREFDPVRFATSESLEEWEYQYGESDSVRLGGNTPSVSTGVQFVFQWDEGHPNGCMPHVGKYHFCAWCGREARGHVSDCLGLRAQALADAVLSGDMAAAQKHAAYIKANHQPKAWMLA